MRFLNLKAKFVTCVVTLIFLCLYSPLFAANLLYYQGFESTGWEDEFTGRSTWEDHVARVTDNPHSDNYCLRGNQNESRTDPLTNKIGENNNVLDWRGADRSINGISTHTPHELYFSFWFRHDDYTWSGTMGGDGKLFYFIDDTYNTRAMYVGSQLATTNYITLKYSNGGYSDQWATDNWGYYRLNISHPSVSAGCKGVWRHFEYYINYDEHYMQFWIDGYIMIPSGPSFVMPTYKSNFPDWETGKIYYDRNLNIHWRGFQFFYIDNAQVNQSTDGNAYANGWQIDDLEVWDGMPGQPTDTPPSITISTPTTQSSHTTTESTINIAGTASDDHAIESVAWSINGPNQPANNDSGDWTSWSIENIALQEGDNVITVTATDSADQTSSDTITITVTSVIDGGGGDSFPSVNILSPTSATTYATSQDAIAISGNASDDNAISSITWSNDRGGSGTAINSSGDWTSWSIENIALQEGDNVITVTATDSADQTSSDTITVTSSDIVQVWSATAQTGDSAFKESVVTYCVRLLIEGDHVTQSGSTVRLGFQGRSSGGYTIRKVSVAERDTGGAEGDVIDSTWTRVTFDGNSEVTWASDVMTVAAGAEKLSDPISFSLQAGKDYYITFKIDTPSLYLNPPAFYRELYFSSADHTEDIDWSDNGHSITQDYHALSKIYVISGETPSVPSAPSGLGVSVSE